jgi:hypothetical protein
VIGLPESASRRTEVAGHGHPDIENDRHVLATGPDSRPGPSGLLKIGRGNPYGALVTVSQFAPVSARRFRHE